MMDPQDDDGDEPMDPTEAMLQRGAFLRKLREMEVQDEQERKEEAQASRNGNDDSDSDDALQDSVPTVLANGAKVLSYDSYLHHQRYYDDLKHVDCQFIDYGTIGPGQLIVEQDKTLGKGGWCWDAAFVLGEILIHNAHVWKRKDDTTTSVLELGTGTGLCGLMVAKAVADAHVSLTDLPELMPLLQRNVARNFESHSVESHGDKRTKSTHLKDDGILSEYTSSANGNKQSSGTLSAFALPWGLDDYSAHGTFDVIVGADVVASLYDPVALARTIWAVAHSKSIVYVSFKERLSTIHRSFEKELRTLFDSIEIVKPTESRNRNPDIQILIAVGRKDNAALER